MVIFCSKCLHLCFHHLPSVELYLKAVPFLAQTTQSFLHSFSSFLFSGYQASQSSRQLLIFHTLTLQLTSHLQITFFETLRVALYFFKERLQFFVSFGSGSTITGQELFGEAIELEESNGRRALIRGEGVGESGFPRLFEGH